MLVLEQFTAANTGRIQDSEQLQLLIHQVFEGRSREAFFFQKEVCATGHSVAGLCERPDRASTALGCFSVHASKSD